MKDVDLLPEFSPQMVMELAANIQEPKDILKRYEMTKVEFVKLSKNPAFKAAYTEAKSFWNSNANVHERIAIKSAIMVEESLPELYDIFTDAAKQPGARLDAFKQMTVLAKVNGGEQKDNNPAGTGQAININIDMGAKTVSTTIDNVIEGELANES